MKRTVLLTACLSLASALFANPVSKQQALQEAQSFMQKHNPGATITMAHQTLRRSANAEQAYYYVFNADDNKGFVVMSGDDRTVPVLGYATSGTFDEENIPDGLQFLLDRYAREIKWLENSNIGGTTAQKAPFRAPTYASYPIEPMMSDILWNQRAPFNNNLPMASNDDDVTKHEQHCSTGCVGAAVGMMLSYYKYPATIKAVPGYITRTDKYEVGALPETTIDWDKILPAYRSKLADQQSAERAEAAKLVQYICTATETDFQYESSVGDEAFVSSALRKYFGFGNSVRTMDYMDYDEWKNTIYNELSNGRVVLISGGGHMFVCDGFDGDDKFSFNWGWSGTANGTFFRFSALDPIPGYHEPFNLNEDGDTEMVAIYGLDTKDTTGGGDDTPVVTEKAKVAMTNAYLTDSRDRRDKTVSTKEMKLNTEYGSDDYTLQTKIYPVLKSASSETVYAYWGMALFNEKGQQVGDISKFSNTTSSKFTTYERDEDYVLFKVDGAIPEGEYFAKAVCSLDNKNWLPVDVSSSDIPYFVVTKGDRKATISKPDPITVTGLKCVGNMTIGSVHKVTVNIKNNLDSDYKHLIYISWSGSYGGPQYCSTINVNIAGGASKNYTIQFTPTKTEHELTVSKINNYTGEIYAETYTFHQPSTTPANMQVAIDVHNKKNESTLIGNTFSADVAITNAGEEEYYDALKVQLVTDSTDWTDAQREKFSQVLESDLTKMAAGEVKQIPVEVANLDYNKTYKLRVIYKKTSTEEEIVETAAFSMEEGLMYWRGDGSVVALENSDNVVIPEDAAAVNLNVKGRPAKITPNSNPNCIYYINYYDAPNSYADKYGLKDKNYVSIANDEYEHYTKASSIKLVDGYECYIPMDFTVTGKITYTRVFKNMESFYGKKAFYGTIVLPFAPTKVMNTDDNRELTWDMTSANVHRFWLKKFYYVDGTDIKFQASNEFLANVPYIITVPCTKYDAEYVVQGKNVEFSAQNVKIRATEPMVKAGDTQFVGVWGTTTVKNAYVNVKGKNFTLQESYDLAPFRGYFVMGKAGANKVREFRIVDADDNEATAIDDMMVKMNGGLVNIYTLGGAKVGQAEAGHVGEVLSTLPKGVYIVNGKKIVK
ncbi:MAG: C10 family peptidase [Prevotella sp.]|nr:C10 family peptidase [Prevotella sp.]